jgi:hypothetical protein
MNIKQTPESEKVTTFAQNYPGWHSFRNDVLTRKGIERAALLGQIEVNRYQQFRYRRET